jgi:hypothetical protein
LKTRVSERLGCYYFNRKGKLAKKKTTAKNNQKNKAD